jgi:hypothetical protein
MSYTTTLKKIKTPSDSMKEYYENLFKRNQMKFMKRSPLTPSHLGSEFSLDGFQFRLIGTMSPVEMIIENLEDGSCYLIHCDYVSRLILEK